jgi:periplasmic protein CpxP/Spy
MKSTKTLFLTALAAGSLLAFGTTVRAGNDTNTPPSAPPPAGLQPHGAGGGIDRIAKQLNLTDDQKPKVQAILKARMDKMLELRQDTSLSQEDKAAKRKAIQDDTTAQMKAVLTAEQFQKWQEMQTQMRNRRPGGPLPGGKNAGSPNAPAPPPEN